MNTRISMSELARRCGYSKATVSMALRNHPRIAASTREKIQAYAKEIGYVPDPLLSSFATKQRTKHNQQLHAAIGLVRSFHHVIERINRQEPLLEELAVQYGYQAHTISAEELVAASNPTDYLFERNIRGLLLGQGHTLFHEEPCIDWSRFSIVSLNTNVGPFNQFHTIDVDHMRMAELSMWQFLQRGINRIGVVEMLHTPTHRDDINRYLGYQQMKFIAPANLELLPLHHYRIPVGHFTHSQRKREDKRLLEWYEKHRPNGIIAYNGSVYHTLHDLTHGDLHRQCHVISKYGHQTHRFSGFEPSRDLTCHEAMRILDQMIRYNITGKAPIRPVTTLLPRFHPSLHLPPFDHSITLPFPHTQLTESQASPTPH